MDHKSDKTLEPGKIIRFYNSNTWEPMGDFKRVSAVSKDGRVVQCVELTQEETTEFLKKNYFGVHMTRYDDGNVAIVKYNILPKGCHV